MITNYKELIMKLKSLFTNIVARYLFVFVFTFCSSIALQGQSWTLQTSGTTQSLYGIYFIDVNKGWAVGYNGTIIHTTNGGTNWTAQTSGITNHLFDVYFIDANNGFAVGEFGRVLKTTNGGTTWTMHGAPFNSGNQGFYGIHFTSNLIGYIAGYNYDIGQAAIYKTTDGGSSWSLNYSSAVDYLVDIHFGDINTGYALPEANNGGKFLKTTNSGTSWTLSTFSANTQHVGQSVFFTDANTGWIAGINYTGSLGLVYKTTNGGSSWVNQLSGSIPGFLSIRFFDANIGWVVGNNGAIYYTANGGTNWTLQPSGITGSSINDISIFNATTAWACGDGGKITKYTCTPSSITLGVSPTVCRGTVSASLPYTATTGTPDTYSIDYDAAANTAGFVDVVNAALPVSPITLTVPGAAAGGIYNATITVIKTVGGCVSPAVPFTITVSATNTPTITPGSATTFCTGGSVVLSSSSASGNQWYVGGNPIGGATNQTYTANANGTYTVVVTSGGCSSSPSAGTTVTVNPTPSTPSITAGSSTTFCVGGSVSLSSSAASGNQWYLNGNPIGGATSQTYVANATGTYTVVVTSNGCGSAPSSGTGVTVNALPNVGATVSPSANVCAGNQVTLSGTGAGSYSWTGGITDGVPFVPAVSNTISQTNAAMLVGLRKLVATYNSNIIQLRRSSDNAIQDFGLSGNDLDVAAINTWLGVATGFCTILYDQSGNGQHVTQTNPSLQPVFVANGINGKPVLHFTAGQQMFNATNFTSPFTVTYAARQTGPNRARVLSSVANNWLLGWWGGRKSQAYFEGWVSNPASPSDNSIYIYTGASNGATSQVYENGSLIANNNGGVTGPNGISLGGWVAGNSEYSDCDFMDVMVYNTVLSNTDRTASESSMSNYYNLPGIPRNILYTVTGTDGNGCSNTATQTITILQPTTSETTVAICNKYTWNGTEYKESGDYVFHTTNAAGCDSAATLHLTILSVTSNTSKTDATCFATGTGSITVNPTYGVAPFTYRIGTVGSYVPNNTFNNLKAGKYRVSILDVNGCAGIASQVTITQPVAITGTANVTNATCYGATNGSISVSPSTATPPYMYRLGNAGAFVNSNVFSNLKADAYRAFIQDANSCVGNFVVQVTQPTKVSGTSTKTDETCPGAKNGTITVNGTGGTPPYSYRFGGSGSFTSTNTFTNLKAGSYRVYVNDANNCSGFSILTTVGQASPSCVISTFAKVEKNVLETTNAGWQLSLSPNPTTNNFTLNVRSSRQESIKLRVIDINGRPLYINKGLPQQTYRFGESFAPGVYLVEVRQGDEVKTVKVIKN